MPETTAQTLYAQAVRGLPMTERLHLAALILAELSQPNVAVIDASAVWSEEDQRDLAAFSLSYAAELYPEGEA